MMSLWLSRANRSKPSYSLISAHELSCLGVSNVAQVTPRLCRTYTEQVSHRSERGSEGVAETTSCSRFQLSYSRLTPIALKFWITRRIEGVIGADILRVVECKRRTDALGLEVQPILAWPVPAQPRADKPVAGA